MESHQIQENINVQPENLAKKEIPMEENMIKMQDIQPNQTIYVNNLNEKIKNDGKN